MSITVRHNGPRTVQRGISTSLDLDVYNAAGVQQTVTSGTVTISLGDKVIVDGAAIAGGAPATYTLPDSVTSGEALSEQYLEKWTVVVGGVTHTHLLRAGYLVRYVYTPAITDTDLTNEDGDALNITNESNLQKYRDLANARIQKDLIKKGRRPWLIFDAWALTDAHVYRALYHLYNEALMGAGQDSRYSEARERYAELYQSEMDSVSFRYDSDETGTITETTQEGSGATLVLSGGPRQGRLYHRGLYRG